MDRRKFLVGLGSASVGGSALLGSGAFSRVESQRAVTIQVAEDPDAYLGMDKCRIGGAETPNSSYAHLDDHGHLEILMNEDNPHHPDDDLGAGVNSDSMTWFHNVFQICNQGKETVCVYIEEFETLENDEEYDEPTVDFYLGDGDYDGVHDRSIVGEENHFELEVGDCVCVGIKTVTKGLSEGDELIVDDDITIVADVDCPDEEPECPWLTGQYECTTYEGETANDEIDNYRRDGTRFRITNQGDASVDHDLAVSNSPNSWREDLTIDANSSRTRTADASVPRNALVVWDLPENCRGLVEPREGILEIIRWDNYKTQRDVEDLHDWFDTFGTEGTYDGAPEDLDDDVYVSELRNIPEREKDDDDVIGPDEDIDPDELWPNMSEDAEDAGWITCEQVDQD